MTEKIWWANKGVKRNMANMPFLVSQLNAIEEASFKYSNTFTNMKNMCVGKMINYGGIQGIPTYYLNNLNLPGDVTPINIYYDYLNPERFQNTRIQAEDFFLYYKTFSLKDNWMLMQRSYYRYEFGFKMYDHQTYEELPDSYYSDIYDTYITSSVLEVMGTAYDDKVGSADFTVIDKMYNLSIIPQGGLESLDFGTLLSFYTDVTMSDVFTIDHIGYWEWIKAQSEYEFAIVDSVYQLNVPTTLEEIMNNEQLVDESTLSIIDNEEELSQEYYFFDDYNSFMNNFLETYETDDEIMSDEITYSEF